MKRLVIASTNPAKIQAAVIGFEQVFPEDEIVVKGVSVPSFVGDQPMGDEETWRGAFNRASGARHAEPNADYWLGMEGGVLKVGDRLQCFAWIVILDRERQGEGRTGAFYLPQEIADLVNQGMELGHADDVVFGRSNSKHKDGSVGLLTGGVINREQYYAHAVVLALIPFLNPSLTFKHPTTE